MKDPTRAFLRHTLATIAYRAAKVERYAPPGFGNFQLGKAARTPVQIVAHMGDLFDWALSMAQGKVRLGAIQAAGVEKGSRAVSRLPSRARQVPRVGCTPWRERRGVVSRPDIRCADAHRSDRDLAAAGRFTGALRGLRQSGHRVWSRRRGAAEESVKFESDSPPVGEKTAGGFV